ncbi:MAG: hypothetical protein K0Q79_465 [Flavipsychrobacter sp.]|jgi:hypothetical protein|nr:hypothetical protein [Flavipsychrobacter sp.]
MTSLRILFLSALVLVFATCRKVEKNARAYYPKVKTLSAEKLPDGTVKITGQLTSKGTSDIEFAGFCMDTLPNPGMTQNQVMVSAITGDTFSYTFGSFNTLKKYYFRAWVANGHGYGIGDAVLADSIVFDTTLRACAPAKQKITWAGIPYNRADPYTYISGLTETPDGYDVITRSDSRTIIYSFGQYPISGIYKTSGYIGPNNVVVSVDGMKTKGGANVYVEQLFDKTIDITLCPDSVSVRVGLTSWSYYKFAMSTRFRIDG